MDAWTIYAPYPKWLKKKSQGRIVGVYLGCTPTESGMIRCCWDPDDRGIMYPYFGKRIDPKTTPKAFQKIFYNLEKLWNEAITKNTEKAWEKWNLA